MINKSSDGFSLTFFLLVSIISVIFFLSKNKNENDIEYRMREFRTFSANGIVYNVGEIESYTCIPQVYKSDIIIFKLKDGSEITVPVDSISWSK